MKRPTASFLLAISLATAGGVYVFGPAFSSAGSINSGTLSSTSPGLTRVTWSDELDFAAVAGGECAVFTFAGDSVGLDEPVFPGGCGSVLAADDHLTCTMAASAADTVTVQVCCVRAIGCADLPAITFSASALR